MKTKILLIISVASIILSSCKNKQIDEEHEHEHKHEHTNFVQLNKEQQKNLNLKLGHFQMRNLTNVVRINGELKISPENIAEVSAIMNGKIKQIKIFSGNKVNKGQILAVLEHPDFIKLQEDFAQISNNLEYLEQEYNRQKQLFENNVGAGKDFQRAKTEYKNALSRYQALKSRLQMINISPEDVENGKISSAVNIISPINGFVTEIFVKLGSYVNIGDKMFEISDNSKIHADFNVFEKDLQYVNKGSIIHFTVSNIAGKEYTAEVFAIEKHFDKQNRSVIIHSEIKNKSNELLPGMFISGHLHSNQKYLKTLPEEAVVKDGGKYFIFIVDNHKHEEEHEHEDGNEHEEEKHEYSQTGETLKLVPVEVLTGVSENGYIEIKPMQNIADTTKIALNSAYYLLSEMKKSEMEHSH